MKKNHDFPNCFNLVKNLLVRREADFSLGGFGRTGLKLWKLLSADEHKIDMIMVKVR
jgi:hypothetical protein